ncbi:MAG: Bug family tripartite tricarboxylate transporter substrate binding protein [Clostridia bacterium]
MKKRVSMFLGALAFAASLHAEPYPTKPIRLVVGLPAGGGADVLARATAERLAEQLGQPVVVENRVGSGGLVAADAVAHAQPDGYTLLFGGNGSNAIFASLYKKLPYEPVKDFAPVSRVATLPNVLVVNTALPVHSVTEFVAYARAHPGEISYASAGNGTTLHLSMEMLRSMTGIDVVHVPYKGGVQAMGDLLSGRVQAMFEILPTEIANIRAGKVRALAVTTAKRSPQLPEVQTLAEAGVPGFEVVVWYALFAPAATPEPVLTRLNTAAVKALAAPGLAERFAQLGATASASTREQLAAFQLSEVEKWAKVVRASGATAE